MKSSHYLASNNQSTEILVTEPFFPPIEEYISMLEGIWDRKMLTNNGPLVKRLEQEIAAIHSLRCPVHCLANGTLGLQIAAKALGVKGEVISTPFTYIATTSSVLWEGCSIVFADIEREQLTIDPDCIESMITPRTEAILATHVFGNPCDVERIQKIAEKNGLAVIYDAAHAFGVNLYGKSILEWGDISVVSLHATKVMHAAEGGFLVASDPSVSEKVEWLRCFAHKGFDDYHGVGINAKMSELHAAMGLCVLKHYDYISKQRKLIADAYDAGLSKSKITIPKRRKGASCNYSYYPILFESEQALKAASEKLLKLNISCRRYFYPSIDRIAAIGNFNPCEVSNDISSRILCIPLNTHVEQHAVERIVSILLD